MLYELRTYELRPGKAPAYLDLFRREGVGLVTKHLPLLGYWMGETGRLNTIWHLWAYASLAERDACRASLAGEAAWVGGFVPTAFADVLAQRNRLLELERGSPVIERATMARQSVHTNRPAGEPMFAQGLMFLSIGRRPPPRAENEIAAWRCLSGEDAGAWVTLAAGDDLGAPPEPGEIAARVLLRPLALSPLR